MSRSTVLFLVALTGCATTSTTAFYPLDELRALDAPEDHPELLAHAAEVAPSQRNDAWRALVEKAALTSLADVPVKSARDAERVFTSLDTLQTRFPSLKKSKPWLARRAEVAIATFPWTYASDHREWVTRIVDFAKSDALTPHLALRLAEEVVLKRLVPTTAHELIELTMQREGAGACASPTVLKVAAEYADAAEDFPPVTGPCWKQVEPLLVDGIKKADTRTAKLKLCTVLQAHADKAVSGPLCTFD